MYGLIGKMTAVAGQRDALASILIDGTVGMPGCLSYVVAADTEEPKQVTKSHCSFQRCRRQSQGEAR